MIVRLCTKGQPETARETAGQITGDPRVKALLILACDANGWTGESVNPWLLASPVPVFGGIFPQIIAEGKNLEKGTLIIGLFHKITPFILRGISRPGNHFEDILAQEFQHREYSGKTLFIFLDAMSHRIGELIDGLFNTLGLAPAYIGGGAGSLSFIRNPCIITPEGLIADAAILALTDIPSGIGVAHGYHAISEAMKVTEVALNRILSLNWQPAFTLYRQIVEQHSGMSFDHHSFFDMAKAYPLGIARMDAEMIVRDPISVTHNVLTCVGQIPRGSYVHVLHGDRQSLIEGAVHARKMAEANYRGKERKPVLFFIDCISRVLFLGHHFEEEIRSVTQGSFTFGALTLGEIANTGDAFLEFYNKTAVTGLLGESHESCDV
ncbi:FIST C-terminal domain-containing protein [Desulfobotulus sp. H1]|uniref:FIST C-terminal domain-containing protein n=1 Tax=Desulfobotulus pelophilus TaxID=2823377 RepID=A0ABT3N613_9BACT|nr:FIST C-terminal domain-containing protein [Desulfobotulus pelophilus]MCW7752898.1 FIST C-terminal domain-containing protein [Desulfobotulus pelophilus]